MLRHCSSLCRNISILPSFVKYPKLLPLSRRIKLTEIRHYPYSTKVNSSPKPETDGPVLIYEGALKSQIRSVKLFSLTTSGMGVALQPLILSKVGDSSIGALIAVFGMVGFFTYVTPFLIHFIAKRYVTEISHDPSTDKYTAVTYSFFLRRKELVFVVEDILVPEVPGPFTTIVVKKGNKKLPLFLADTGFLQPEHYGRFMGYDKPIDFKLGVQEVNTGDASKISEQSKTSRS